jgi:hypothetical protein
VQKVKKITARKENFGELLNNIELLKTSSYNANPVTQEK